MYFYFFQEEILIEWIDVRYLHPEITEDIQKEFEENSEIQLNDFLKVSNYLCCKISVLNIRSL